MSQRRAEEGEKKEGGRRGNARSHKVGCPINQLWREQIQQRRSRQQAVNTPVHVQARYPSISFWLARSTKAHVQLGLTERRPPRPRRPRTLRPPSSSA